MNRTYLTIMTFDDHRAAAHEWSTVHRSVAEFENAIFKTLKDGRRADRSAAEVCCRIPDTVKRIHKALDRIQAGMRARRFLDIIRLRRHLPVRIMDDAIRVLHQFQFLRCQMEDLQFHSLRGRGIPWVNCWLGSFNYFDGGAVGSPDMGNTALELEVN
jgi:hypothetical protein